MVPVQEAVKLWSPNLDITAQRTCREDDVPCPSGRSGRCRSIHREVIEEDTEEW
jgi:hypothetical protein